MQGKMKEQGQNTPKLKKKRYSLSHISTKQESVSQRLLISKEVKLGISNS